MLRIQTYKYLMSEYICVRFIDSILCNKNCTDFICLYLSNSSKNVDKTILEILNRCDNNGKCIQV